MRVVHVCCVVPPEGGMGTVAFKETAFLRARGVDAHLIVPTSKRVVHDSSSERSFVDFVHPLVHISNAAILPPRIMREKFRSADLIHLHYPFYGTAEWVLSGTIDKPVVMTFHMDARAGGLKEGAFFLHRKLIQPFLLDHARKIFVSSFDHARSSSLASFFHAHPDRVIELPYGVDVDFFSPGLSSKERFGVPRNAQVITFVGQMDQAHAFKGIPQLLQTMTHLDSHIHLVLIGDGDLRSSYEQQARALGVASRVHFLGRLDDESLRDAQRIADVFTLPSTEPAEAFGLVALEAQSCGVPAVTSNFPGVRTVIKHGETGLLIEPKNVDALTTALQQILWNDDLRKRMGQAARQFVLEKFSWERHIDGLMQVYQEVCASPF